MEDIIERASKACGGLSKLASLMGASSQTIWNWRKRGVPIEQCAALERLSGNKVRRWDLRPTDWHRIWPELIGTDGAPDVPADATATIPGALPEAA